jgi:superfamily II DNA helicase RecQ
MVVATLQQMEWLSSMEALLDDQLLRAMYRKVDVSLHRPQCEMLQAIADGHEKILYMAGTGSGKSTIYALLAFALPNIVTVVVQLLKSLQCDTLRRLEEFGINAMIWAADDTSEEDEVVPSVVLVTPEAMAMRNWKMVVTVLNGRKLIERVILDEE